MSDLNKALEVSRRAIWESQNPNIPWDITVEEAERGTVVGGRFQLAEGDVRLRASRGLADDLCGDASSRAATGRAAA